jgi:hypothetical protein
MRITRPTGVVLAFAVAGTALAGTPASAQDALKAALPDTTACPDAVAAIATCYLAKDENGGFITAAMPKNWNGDLIVFAHGGPSLVPPTPNGSKSDLERNAFEVQRGFAWVASSYRREGYGVGMAAADTDNARKFFIARIAKPRRTIMHGTSYGGLVGAKLIETYAKGADGGTNYDGAFFNSGAVYGATLNYQHRVDLRAVYQYYCKNMPRPGEPQYPLWNGVAPDSKMSLKDLSTLVDGCTGVDHPAAARSDAQKQNLANIIGVMGYPENLLVRHMQSATLLFRDIVKNTTGSKNPFGNADIRYHGSSDDAALNRDVVRFTADPVAAAAVKADGDPTGVLPVPVVAIHSLNDPQVVVEAESVYRATVNAAGSGDRLVQAYTDERAHAGQSAPERAAALDGLMQWLDKGTKPTAQSIAAGCEAMRASLDGPCRYHPDFSPKPYDTRYYPREAAVR